LCLVAFIEQQAHRAFFGAILVPNLVLLFSLISVLWNEAGWLYYHIAYWLFFWVPGIYCLSWLYAFIVVPLWVNLFNLTFSIRHLAWLCLFNVGIAICSSVLLAGGIEKILELPFDYEFVMFVFLLSLVVFSISWFMIGGWGVMKKWWGRLTDFWNEPW
jgi:hypothetical protein